MYDRLCYSFLAKRRRLPTKLCVSDLMVICSDAQLVTARQLYVFNVFFPRGGKNACQLLSFLSPISTSLTPVLISQKTKLLNFSFWPVGIWVFLKKYWDFPLHLDVIKIKRRVGEI